MSPDLGPPAIDEQGAGLLISEGLCPHCHGDLVPGADGLGVCAGCELGWAVRTWFFVGTGQRMVEVRGGHFVEHLLPPDPLPW